MARHDILKNPIKLQASKQVFKQLDNYIEGLAEHNETLDDDLLEYAGALQKFRNKRTGELKKTALRTNKARQEFNDIISNLKKTPQLSKKYRQEQLKKKRAEMNKGLLTVFTEDNKRDFVASDRAHEIFKADVFKNMFDSGEIYELVMDNSKENIISVDDIIDVFQTIRDRYELRTPEASKEFLQSDDRYKVLEDILDRVDELGSRGNGDVEDFIIIVRDALQALKQENEEKYKDFFDHVRKSKGKR